MLLKISKKLTRGSALLAAVAVLLFNVSYLLLTQQAQAAAFTNVYLRIDRMKASTATTGTVCAKVPSTTPVETGVRVTFPTGFVVSTTLSNWTVTTTNLPAGGTAWPGISTPTNAISGQSVDFVSGDLTSTANTYCFNWNLTAALTTSSAGADKTGTIATCTTYVTCSASIADSSNYATSVIADDQITVTATVPATFNMTIGTCGSNTDALGILSTASVTSSATACRLTFTTNAVNGWIVWAKDSQQGLRSTTQSYTIPGSSTMDDNCAGADDDITAGVEGFGVDSNIITDAGGGGTVTIDGDFACGVGFVGDYDTTFTEVATANGAANGDVIDLVHEAAISGLTPPATDYSDIVTVSGAGNF